MAKTAHLGSSDRFRLIRCVSALMLREMSTTYGRSPGGYVWAVLEPVLGTALLTFAFSLAFRSPPLGTNFALFYATGLLPFMMYMDLTNKVSSSVQFSRQLLFYPRVTFIDAIIARFVLNLITHLIVVSLILTGIIVIFNLQLIIHMPSIVSGLAMAAALSLGIGILNCYLMATFPVWPQFWGILNRPLFIVSCIFFLPESIPEPFRGYLEYNPLVHIVGEMRRGFYPGYEASYVSVTYVYFISLVVGLLGLVFLFRFIRDILNQ